MQTLRRTRNETNTNIAEILTCQNNVTFEHHQIINAVNYLRIKISSKLKCNTAVTLTTTDDNE